MRICAVFCLLLLVRTSSSAAQADSSDALKQSVAAFQAAWNAHDAGAVAALFAPDGDLIMADGPVTQGKGAIQQWWRDRFARMGKSTSISLTVRTVRSIASDVALLNVLAKTSGELPQQMGSSEDRGTWVMVRQGGQWRISALRVQQTERPAGR